ncbi:MAG TPA: TonB-dependent receptor [Rubrivivax sp.]|nr:TonB-dependent receptor [Rubrivivax sp.]
MHAAAAEDSAPRRLLPLGALAAGFGLMQMQALAQVQLPAVPGAPASTVQAPAAPAATPPAADAAPAAPPASSPAPAAPAAPPAASPAAAPAGRETTLPAIAVTGKPETDATSLRATTTSVGRGLQEQRDIPQSVTVVTDRLMEDRQVDTLNQALHLMGGISFLAAEGGEQDIRLRGFSMSGDIYVDTIHDPGFYDRDTFNFDRIELLRGSASMLFGRGSTGGVVNQVSKQPFLDNANVVNFTAGNDGFLRFTGDFNLQTGDTSAVRFNLMRNTADNNGNSIDKEGAAVNFRWGIGTRDEFYAAAFYLNNDNGINYGLPWLRASSAQADGNPSVMIPGLNPNNAYYGAPSDYNAGGTTYGTLGWLHRFGDGGELRSTLRYGVYDRDQRASTIRFCQNNNGNNPDCPATPQGLDTISAATLLNRGTNNKVQDMSNTYLQFDYTNRFDWFGADNEVLAGLDLAHEKFSGYAMVLPPGVTLDKNSPRTTLGNPDNGYGWVDESLRIQRQQAAFDARAAGVFAQDLIQVAPDWKVLLGLRYDYFRGEYQSFQTADGGNVPPGTVTADRRRSEGLWSERFGVLYQPTPTSSWYFSYGTSFNTSGDTYQYDLPGSNTPPEESRNLELGTYFTLFNGRLSARASIFNITKYHERNRDSPAGTPIDDYLLSGRRHATGIDIDVAGRITPLWDVFVSYAWIPIAEIDEGNADGSAISGERVGQRPSLTPRNSGSVWTTYQLLPQLRLGGGVTFRSSQTPNRNPPGIVAPSFITGDLMAQVDFSDAVALMLNVTNLSNRYYADTLYSGHYVPGAPRAVQATLTLRF